MLQNIFCNWDRVAEAFVEFFLPEMSYCRFSLQQRSRCGNVCRFFCNRCHIVYYFCNRKHVAKMNKEKRNEWLLVVSAFFTVTSYFLKRYLCNICHVIEKYLQQRLCYNFFFRLSHFCNIDEVAEFFLQQGWCCRKKIKFSEIRTEAPQPASQRFGIPGHRIWLLDGSSAVGSTPVTTSSVG